MVATASAAGPASESWAAGADVPLDRGNGSDPFHAYPRTGTFDVHGHRRDRVSCWTPDPRRTDECRGLPGKNATPVQCGRGGSSVQSAPGRRWTSRGRTEQPAGTAHRAWRRSPHMPRFVRFLDASIRRLSARDGTPASAESGTPRSFVVNRADPIPDRLDLRPLPHVSDVAIVVGMSDDAHAVPAFLRDLFGWYSMVLLGLTRTTDGALGGRASRSRNCSGARSTRRC